MKKIVLTLAYALTCIAAAFAQPEYHDSNFGSNSIITQNPLYQGSTLKVFIHDDAIYAFALDLSAGLTMRKYNAAGEQDTNFVISIPSDAYYWSVGDAFQAFAEVTSNEKILLATHGLSPNDNPNVTYYNLSRYNLDGTIDTSYGTNGYATIPYSEGDYVMLLNAFRLPNEDLITIGHTGSSVWIDKFDENGTRYTNLWDNGRITYDFTQADNFPYQACYSAEDNSIYISFINMDSDYNIISTILKLNLGTGLPDTGFGTAGVITLPITEIISRFTLTADNKILVATQEGYTSILRKYNADGSPVTEFGNNGSQAFIENEIRIRKLVAETDGKITVLGEKTYEDGVAIFKVNADGTADTDFGTGGKIAHENANAQYWVFDYAENEDYMILGGSYRTTGELEPSIIKLFKTAQQPASATGVTTPAVTLYPNPTAGQVNLQTEKDIVSAEVYTITGQRADTFTITGNMINVAQLASGTYLLKLYDSQGSVYTKKLVKM